MTTRISDNFTMSPMNSEDYVYSFIQPEFIARKAGGIAHIDLYAGKDPRDFGYSWFDHSYYWEIDVLKGELNKLLEKMKGDEYEGLLGSRERMKKFLSSRPELKIKKEYCFKIRSDYYTYLFRLSPERRNDFNGCCYLYRSEWLDKHMEEARGGVIFNGDDYESSFTIRDGGKIKEIYPDGYTRVEQVRFLSDMVFTVGHSISQKQLSSSFISSMKGRGITVEPVRKDLISAKGVYLKKSRGAKERKEAKLDEQREEQVLC